VSQTSQEELLAAVRAFLREKLLPQLEGFNAYTTRVAANSLGIVSRELELGPQRDRLDEAIAARLELDPAGGSVACQLATGLRDGSLHADAQLLEYLRQRTLLALEIDNPRYSGYLQARERWGDRPTQEH
jgi:hypothetical protein